jgi:hypothetical protein
MMRNDGRLRSAFSASADSMPALRISRCNSYLALEKTIFTASRALDGRVGDQWFPAGSIDPKAARGLLDTHAAQCFFHVTHFEAKTLFCECF